MKTNLAHTIGLSCAFLLTSACRFGGLSGNAVELVDPAVDGGTGLLDDEGSDRAAPADPAEVGNEGDPGAAGDGDSTDDGPGDNGSDQCTQSSPVPGCDPVKGTNCTMGINQCVVDPDSATPAGRCVFPSAALPMGCDENVLYTTCPSGFTCKQGECRKYCYCDTDCDQGDTCSESSGQGGSDVFKLCMNTRP